MHALSYMGTKRWLAGAVSALVEMLPPGPLLDAFAGMCAVGCAVGTKRQIWTNDILTFPSMLARTLLTFRMHPASPKYIIDILHSDFVTNFSALKERFGCLLENEDAYISRKSTQALLLAHECLPHVAVDSNLEQERKQLEVQPTSFPYRLFTITYAGGYFGLRQALEIDSFRFALDAAREKKSISEEEWCRCLIALGAALSRCSNSTGHFAQYLKPSLKNANRVLAKRRRSIRSGFLDALRSLSPIGSVSWRQKNRVFQEDALQLLPRLFTMQERPVIVFADPPYSKAQYSRYYHILDTLIRYDYPPSTGIGRYRPDRHATPFSQAGNVHSAMEEFVIKCSRLEAVLVMSYPDNGLLITKGYPVGELLQSHYPSVTVVSSSTQSHSSFGGPRASPKSVVTERVYLARMH